MADETSTRPDKIDRGNFSEILGEMDAGVFEQKLTHALANVALGVVYADKKTTGKVVIELDVSRIHDSGQVAVGHTLKYTKPTKNGKTTEVDKTTTVFHVLTHGKLSIIPDSQTDLFGKGDPA